MDEHQKEFIKTAGRAIHERMKRPHLVEVVGRLKLSLPMKRFIHSAKMYESYCVLEKRALKGKKKWGRKLKYYEKKFDRLQEK